MADNVTITPGTGATIATDEVTIDGALAQVQRVKPVHGVAGSAVDASATDPLPTTDAAVLAKLAATPALEHATAGSPASARLSDGTTYIGSTAQRLHVDDGGSSLTVDGTVTADRASSTATLSNVASSATTGTLLSANSSRKAFTIFNDSTAVLYVKFGTTASATSYTVAIAAGGYYESPMWNYTGRIDGIWVSANGSARLTELT